MELTRRDQRRDSQRCPYCHDVLEGRALAQQECPGCGTIHHRACVQELGRCSVYGCGHTFLTEDDDRVLVEDGPAVRMLRQRLRERARRFVEGHSRYLADRLRDALAEARAMEAAGRYLEAERAYLEVAYLEGRPEARSDPDVARVEGRLDRVTARARAREMAMRQLGKRFRQALAIAVVFAAVCVGLLLLLGW